jgi:hypothetical protein
MKPVLAYALAGIVLASSAHTATAAPERWQCGEIAVTVWSIGKYPNPATYKIMFEGITSEAVGLAGAGIHFKWGHDFYVNGKRCEKVLPREPER